MKPAKRKAIIIAAACMAAGLLISFAALAALDFNFFEMGTMEPVTNTYALTEGFRNIRVWGAECDVRLLPSEDEGCAVLCRETDRITHVVTVENDTLTIERTDDRKWYEHIGFMWNYRGPIEVVVYLPERAYEALNIRTLSGDVEIPDDFSFGQADVDDTSGDIRLMAAVEGDLSIKSVSGDVTVDSVTVGGAFSCKTVSGRQEISHVSCRSASLNATSGDVLLSELIASEDIRAEAISGNVELVRCDADTLWLKTISGSVVGTLRTEKVFVATTTSGRINVPDMASGGRCEVKTTSGDIRLEVLDR